MSEQSQVYINKTQDISSIKGYKQYKHVRYKHKWEIERNRKHGRFVSRVEHPCSTSPPSTLWRISAITIPQDHSMPQHLRVHTGTLGPASPSLVPARTTHASTLTCRGHTSTPSSYKKSKQHEPASSPPQIQRWTLGDLYTLINKNTLTINNP